jgi:hypothetical protein
VAVYAVQPYISNPNNSGAAPMPRPKSELTSVAKNVGVRLIPAHYEEWKKLGGPKWLRQQLAKSIQEKKSV